jgi:hypothetical protein
MYIDCLIRKGMAYIACYVEIGNRGPYRQADIVGPISVQETIELRRALHDAILRGTPVISESDPRARADAGLLRLAGVKSWATLYSKAFNWEISDYGGHYRLSRLKRVGRGWEKDPDQTIQLQPDATAEDAAQRLVEMIQVATTER